MSQNISKYIFENDVIGLLPEIYFSFSIVVLLFLGVCFDKYIISLGISVGEVIRRLSIFTVINTILLYINQYGSQLYLLNYQIEKNQLIIFLIILILIGLLVCLFFAKSYMLKDTINEYEFILLMMLSTLGIIVLITGNDLLVMYLGVELQSLALYILATFKQESNYSTEAGLKYFILGAFSSGILLLGISLFYGCTGLINFTDISYLLIVNELDSSLSFGIVIGIVLILCGLLFKVGAAPFHMWLPDIYEGAPTIVTSFFAIVPKIAIFGLIGKLYFSIFTVLMSSWSSVFVYCSLFSLIIGSIGALYQTKIKRLIAYSAIGHTGFILLGFVAGGIEGLQGVFLYILIYVILIINMFGIILSLRKQTDFKLLKVMGNFNQLYNNNKLLIISFSLLLFSIAGIPPLAGFYSKLYVLFAIMKEGQYFIALLGVLLSVVGAVYYIRLIKIMFFNIDKKWGFFYPVETSTAYVIVITSLIGLFFSLYSYPLMLLIHEIVLASFY
jgi:NADH-quinone oxidoreductase subunit N